MIPRRFFWIFDGILLLGAFLAAAVISGWIRQLMESKGILSATWIAALSPEPEWAPQPISHQIWILVVAAFPIIIFLEIAGNYGKWVHQSMTRIIAAGPVASVLGLSTVSLVPFALRNPSIRLSRLLLFSFVILSAIDRKSVV